MNVAFMMNSSPGLHQISPNSHRPRRSSSPPSPPYTQMGKSTCYVNIEQQSASHMVLVNYWDAKLSTVPLTPDGTVGTPTEVLMQPGAAYVATQQPTREEHWTYRQRWPHSHCCVTEPYTQQHMFVTDLGLDKVFAYTLDAAAGCLIPQVRIVMLASAIFRSPSWKERPQAQQRGGLRSVVVQHGPGTRA